jgi:hypothetical protein
LALLGAYFTDIGVEMPHAQEVCEDMLAAVGTLRGGSDMLGEIKALKRHFLADASQSDVSAKTAGTVRLTRISEQLRERAEAEASVTLLASTTELDAAKLLREGARAFSQSSSGWDSLQESEREDLEEAGASLLAGCPTGAVLLSLRAAESILRRHYTGRFGLDPGRRGWGKLLGELREKDRQGRQGRVRQADSTTDQTLLDLFSWLKDIRDSVAHPEYRPRQEDAEAVFLAVTNEVVGKAGLQP